MFTFLLLYLPLPLPPPLPPLSLSPTPPLPGSWRVPLYYRLILAALVISTRLISPPPTPSVTVMTPTTRRSERRYQATPLTPLTLSLPTSRNGSFSLQLRRTVLGTSQLILLARYIQVRVLGPVAKLRTAVTPLRFLLGLSLQNLLDSLSFFV